MVQVDSGDLTTNLNTFNMRICATFNISLRKIGKTQKTTPSIKLHQACLQTPFCKEPDSTPNPLPVPICVKKLLCSESYFTLSRMHLQDLPENSAVIIQREIRKAPKRGLLHLHFNGVGKSALLCSVTQPLVSSNVFQAESTLNQVNVYQNFSRKFKQMINFRPAAFSHIHMLHSIHRRFCILHQLGNAISRTIGMGAKCIRQCFIQTAQMKKKIASTRVVVRLLPDAPE